MIKKMRQNQLKTKYLYEDLITEANSQNYDFCYRVTEVSKKKTFHLDNRCRNRFWGIDNFF